jgi:hypothetical protein
MKMLKMEFRFAKLRLEREWKRHKSRIKHVFVGQGGAFKTAAHQQTLDSDF